MKICNKVNYTLCVLLMISACSSFSAGLYIIFGFHHMTDNILPTFDEAKAKVQKMIKTINRYPGIAFDNPPNVSHSNPLLDIRMDKVVHGFGYGLLGIGVALAIIGVTGVMATYRKSNRLQCIIFDMVKDFFLHELYYYFKSIRSDDPVSIGWNLVMQKFDCCGVDSYMDFNASKSFDDVWGEPFHTFRAWHLYSTALACCNSILITFLPVKFQGPCHETDYEKKKGCFGVFLNAVGEYKTVIVVAVVCVIVLQVLLVAVNGFILKKSMTKQRQVDNKLDDEKDDEK